MTKLGLSENDLEIIKMHCPDLSLSSIAKKSLLILSLVYGGLHHIPGRQLDKFNYQNDLCSQITLYGSLATWDTNTLTNLVILAHEMAVRIQVSSSGLGYLKLMFHEREREGATYERHPTIEEAVARWR